MGGNLIVAIKYRKAVLGDNYELSVANLTGLARSDSKHESVV